MAPSNTPPRPLLPKLEPGAELTSPPLDSIPDGEPAPKRRCVSTACEPCRKRKSKCDGVNPSCSACINVYDTPCYYAPDSDHRRKGALRKEIRELKAETSEQAIILDAIRKGSEAHVEEIIQLIRTKPNEPYESIADSIKKMNLYQSKKSYVPSLESEIADIGQSSLSKVGETQHYGHTSNLTALESEERSFPITEIEVGTWTTVTTDGELVKHLLQLYFTWSHAFYLLFPEEVFWHGFNNRKLKYCSSMLVNAVLAVACNLSDRPEARADPADPSTVGNHFFAEARRLLLEDDRSCLTTIQALGVMSVRQAMNNYDSSGWEYAGRMMTMSVEMGLHISSNGPQGNITPTEIETRRITFWGCFVLETAWAICVGRISSLPRTAVHLDKPIPREKLEKRIWKPYGDERSSEYLSQFEQSCFTYSIFQQLILLSEIVNDTVQMFYAPRDRITSRKLKYHHERFQRWHKNLPSSLAIKEGQPTLPQVLTLHMYYHTCVSHLFRPFVRVAFKEGTKAPRQICTEEAVVISQLMMAYSANYGLRRGYIIGTHCIMSAAIIHLLNMSSPEQNPAMAIQAADYLFHAIKILHDMRTAFEIVTRYFQTIRSLATKWNINLPANVRQALDAVDTPSPVSSNSISSSSPEQEPSKDSSSNNSDRKDSAPDLLQPPTDENVSIQTQGQQQYLWTPFPESMDGMPVSPPPTFESTTGGMDISGLLDSEHDTNWGQLSRDGFTIDITDLSAPLLDENWLHREEIVPQ